MNDDYIGGLHRLGEFNGIETDSIDEEIIESIFKCPSDIYRDDDDGVRDGVSTNTFYQHSSDEHTTSVEEKIFLVEKKKKITLKDKFNKYRQIALQRKKHRVECSSNSNNGSSNGNSNSNEHTNNMKDIIDKKILKKESNRISAQKSRDKKKEEYKCLIQENTLLKHKIAMMYNIMINCTQCKQHICNDGSNDIAINNDTVEIQTPILTTTTTSTSTKHCSRKQLAIFTGGMISTIAILCIMSLCSNTNNIYVNNNNNTNNNNIRTLHNNYYVHKYANYTNVDESLYYTNINNNNDNTNEINFYVDYYANSNSNSNNNKNNNDDWSYYIENKENVINTQDGILHNSSLPVIYQSALDRDEIWTEIEKNALLFLVKDPIWILSVNITNVIKNIDDGQEYKPISYMFLMLSVSDSKYIIPDIGLYS